MTIQGKPMFQPGDKVKVSSKNEHDSTYDYFGPGTVVRKIPEDDPQWQHVTATINLYEVQIPGDEHNGFFVERELTVMTNHTKPADWTPSKGDKVLATQDISFPSHPNALQTTMTLIQKGTLGEVVLPNSSSGKHLVKFLYSSPSLGGYGTISQIEVLPSWIEPANAQPANQKPVEPSNTWTPEKHEKIVTTKDLSLQPADADHFRTVPTINLPKGTQGYVILPDSPKGKHFVQLFSTPNDRGECAELGRFDIDHSDLSPLHPKPPLGDLTHAKTYAQDILSGESDYSPTPDWNNSNLATAFLNLLHRKPQKKTVSCYVCGGIGRITTKEAIRNHTRETEHCKERGGRGFTPANNPETQDAPNQTASLDASRCPHGNQPQYREICQLRSDLLLSRLQWNALETIVTLNFPQYAEEIISKAIKRARENHSKEEASNRRNDAMPTPTKEEKFVCPTEAKLHP